MGASRRDEEENCVWLDVEWCRSRFLRLGGQREGAKPQRDVIGSFATGRWLTRPTPSFKSAPVASVVSVSEVLTQVVLVRACLTRPLSCFYEPSFSNPAALNRHFTTATSRALSTVVITTSPKVPGTSTPKHRLAFQVAAGRICPWVIIRTCTYALPPVQ